MSGSKEPYNKDLLNSMEKILSKEQGQQSSQIQSKEGILDKINVKLEEIQIESLKLKYGIGYHEDDPKLKYKHQQ